MTRLLLIEDDSAMSHGIELTLSAESFYFEAIDLKILGDSKGKLDNAGAFDFKWIADKVADGDSIAGKIFGHVRDHVLGALAGLIFDQKKSDLASVLRLAGARSAYDQHYYEILSRAKLRDFDIVIFDLQTDHVSGFQVLKNWYRAKMRTPVLIFVDNEFVEEKVRALGFRDDDYLTKPFDKNVLLGRLRAIASKPKLADGLPSAVRSFPRRL